MKRLVSIILVMVMAFSVFAAGAKEESYALKLFEGNDSEALYNQFSQAVKKQLSLENFQALVPQLIGAYGALESIGDPSEVPFGDQTIVTQVITFEKQTLIMKLSRDAAGEITGLVFSPNTEPVKPNESSKPLPECVIEEAVTVGEGEYALEGVLTMPKDAQNVKAVVLVQGSGPSDRDETIGSNKPFRDIAYALAQDGISSIRYDKRTYVYGGKMDVQNSTIDDEMIQDAISAGKLLTQTPQVDADQIFLLGHSLGAMQAPRIVLESNGIFKGMILMAGSPKSLLDIIIAQNRAVIAQLSQDIQSQQNVVLQAEIDRAEEVFKLPVEEIKKETVFGQPAYYFYEMLQVDPIQTIQALQLPTFILQGDGDFQVTTENGINAYKTALGDDASYVQYKLYSGLNHLMMPSVQTQSVKDYEAALTVDETVTADIAAFVQGH